MKKARFETDIRNSSSSSSSSSSVTDLYQASLNRIASQKKVAENRSPAFARPSSTPTGTEALVSGSSASEWHGPFAVARDLANGVENAKLEREKKIREDMMDVQTDRESGRPSDVYDAYLLSLKEHPSASIPDLASTRRAVRPLVDLSLDSVAVGIDLYLTEGLGDMSTGDRAKLAVLLGARRKLSDETVNLLANTGTQSLILPECSTVSAEALKTVITKCSIGGIEHGCTREPGLKVLQLDNCGFGFTDATLAAVLPALRSVEVLQLTGCYRLSDASIATLVKSLPNLRHVDFATSSHLSNLSIAAMAEHTEISSLRLDNSLKVQGASLRSFASLKTLQSISFASISDLEDADVITLLEAVGSNFKSVNFAGCHLLTDAILISMRTHCKQLQEIDFSRLNRLSSIGLVGLFLESDRTEEHSIGSILSAKFRDVKSVTDEVIIHLCKSSARTLRVLEVSGCQLLTNRAVAALAIHCSTYKPVTTSPPKICSQLNTHSHTHTLTHTCTAN